jgi:hypothetical protein
LFQVCILALETAMKYYSTGSVYGYALYIDGSNPTAGHIFQFKPIVLKNIFHSWQKCYPMRYKKIVFFNISTVIDYVMSFVRLFMTKKLKSRLLVFSHEHCFEDIPADALPVEYGGTGGTLQELTGIYGKLNK